MGKVKQVLSNTVMPDRKGHNSRLFVDLCENIHIHHREFRIVFSLDEYFEFVDTIQKYTQDVRNYLIQNPDYCEGDYNTTLMVASGVKKTLENSPEPNKSKDFDNTFAIELQDESVIDEIHVHWRDYRFALDIEHFKIIANSFTEARESLELFEISNNYKRKNHSDRTSKINKKKDNAWIMGEQEVEIRDISTRFLNFEKEFKPDPNSIDVLCKKYRQGERVFPILLSTEKNGKHIVIDGQHRLLSAKKAGLEKINCIITNITFKQSNNFRKAEGLLKAFDRETGYVYNTSGFNREFFAYKMNQYYKDHFYRTLRPSLLFRIKSALKKTIKRFKNRSIELIKQNDKLHSLAKNIYHKLKNI